MLPLRYAAQGIRIHLHDPAEAARLAQLLGEHDLAAHVTDIADVPAGQRQLALRPDTVQQWTPRGDTAAIVLHRELDTTAATALEQEILVALLASPVRHDFPSVAELECALHVRRNIVLAGRCTALDFHTEEADRPEDCWDYSDERGFVIRPGHGLIEALKKATQPELTGRLYAFSCYRASEYVILLGIAEELARCNPALLADLQRQCEHRLIRSGQFHDVFLREFGSQQAPLPPGYYVPGDRLWFRNPDETSSDVAGYEGSWVLYLGQGLFTNFWKRDRPYTLRGKCLEIYHWRHGVQRTAGGDYLMDEDIVEDRVRHTAADPRACRRILAEMMRWREPQGHWGRGGCIDTTREAPRWLCPDTTDLVLPMQ